MSDMIIIILVAVGVILCVMLSAFFSSSEIAISSCNQLRMENAMEAGDKRAGSVLKCLRNYEDTLAAILIGNNLVNILASSLSSVLVILLIGEGFSWIATVLITLLVIIFGETVPKIHAKTYANQTARTVSPVIRALTILLYPVIFLTVNLVKLITRLFKDEDLEDMDPEEHAEEQVEELSTIIETAGEEEVLDDDQAELVQSAIDFSDVSASEAMTARVDMTCIDIEEDPEEIRRILEESTFSRVPVYEESVDNIIGILRVNRYLKAIIEDPEVNIRELLMEPGFVYKTVKLPQVLEIMRKLKQHLLIVTDEYGGTEGVISMDDVLEEIVGEMWDETDQVEEEIVTLADGKFELDGDMPIDDFLELMEIDEDEADAESETLGGFTMERFGGFPEEGQSIETDGVKITVLDMDVRRVEKVLVEKIEEEEEE